MTRQQLIGKLVAKREAAMNDFFDQLELIANIPGSDIDQGTAENSEFVRLSVQHKRLEAYENLLALASGYYPEDRVPPAPIPVPVTDGDGLSSAIVAEFFGAGAGAP